MSELPIACTLSAEDVRARRDDLLPGLVRKADVCERLEDGLRARFAASSEVLAEITRVIDAERQCCRFLRFTLTVEPAGAGITLELSGPTGTVDFLAALLEA